MSMQYNIIFNGVNTSTPAVNAVTQGLNSVSTTAQVGTKALGNMGTQGAASMDTIARSTQNATQQIDGFSSSATGDSVFFRWQPKQVFSRFQR
jgi:phage tail tape-measure protein